MPAPVPTSVPLRIVDDAAIRGHEAGVTIAVWAVPGARRNEILGRHGDTIRIRVAAPPEDGKANRAIADLLKAHTGCRRVDLVRGGTSRRKVFLLHDAEPAAVAAALALDADA